MAMIKRITIMVLLGLLTVGTMFSATKTVEIEELQRPESIVLDDNQIYFNEGASMYIYGQKDFKLIKKFGKRGEGPQEFIVNPQIPIGLNVDGKNITIMSFGKVSNYTKAGEFINETKTQGGFLLGCQAVEDGYLGTSVMVGAGTRYRAIHLYDAKLNKGLELVKWEDDFQQGKGLRLLNAVKAAAFYEGKIYLFDGNDFKVDVVDLKGKKLHSFTHKFEKVKVTNELRKQIDNFLKTSAQTKNVYNFLLPLRFPDVLPDLRDVRIDDGKIYVLTFERSRSQKTTDWYIFDLKGKFLRKTSVPMKYQDTLRHYPYDVHKGKLYQIVDNEVEEVWELHITDL